MDVLRVTSDNVAESSRRSVRSSTSSIAAPPSVAGTTTATATTATRRPNKMVRISSIENPTRHLRETKAHDAASQAAHRASEHRSATFDQLALLYAIALTLFGFVFPLSNYVSVKPFSAWYLAGFYIILYAVSIAFLVFFLCWILRRPAHILFLPQQPAVAAVGGGELRRSRRRPVVFHLGMHESAAACDDADGQDNDAFDAPGPASETQETREPAAASATAGEARIELQEPERQDYPDSMCSISDASSVRSYDPQLTVNSAYSDATSVTTAVAAAAKRRRGGMSDRINSTLLQNARELGVQEIPACSVLSLQESHSPSFFLRVACFIFGALKVTHEALMIVDTLTNVASGCEADRSGAAGQMIQYALSICFTVLQTFFIFKYSKVSVNVYRNISILGFMHLMATNMCIWFQAVLLETSHSNYTYKVKIYNSSSGSYSVGCSKDVFWRLAPYLFPFTIEYALMAALSCFTLYRNVSKFLDVIQTNGFNVAKKCLRNRMRSQTSFSASCYKTDKGFFLGAFLLILGLVSGIYFTVYVNNGSGYDQDTSQLIYEITDLVLLTANLGLCIVAYCKLQQLTLVRKVGTGPDSWLLGITLVGVLAFQLFQLFGAASEQGFFIGLRLAQGLLAMVQSTFQVYLVLDGEKRRSRTEEAIKEKPGREMIAALLLGNLAQWLVYTLEIREINSLPNYSQAYVPVASNIFVYVCSPLIIFFRFHSACCFVEIWRTAYKSRKRRSQSHPDLSARATLPGSINSLAVANDKSHV